MCNAEFHEVTLPEREIWLVDSTLLTLQGVLSVRIKRGQVNTSGSLTLNNTYTHTHTHTHTYTHTYM
ncbi:hypothetical protein FKM82_019337 [Ascaphus truei]